MYTDLIRLLRTLPTPLRADLLSYTHALFETTQQGKLSNPSLLAQAVSFRAYSRAEDLHEPSKDGPAPQAFSWSSTLDTLEGIEAVERGVQDFKKALKAQSGKDLSLQEAFVAFLADVYGAASDESMKMFLQGHIKKIAKDVNSRGLRSEIIETTLKQTP